MKNIRFKKLLCLFLSVIIVSSLTTPLSVFATGDENTRNDLIRQVIAGIITPEEACSKLGVSSLLDIMPRSSGNLLEDATYYLNNFSFGKYLHYVTPSQDSDFELLGSSDTSIQAEDNNLFADDTEQVDPNVIGLEILPINCISGTLSTLGNTIQWEIQYVPYSYVIRAKHDPTKYLAVSESTTARALTVATITNSTVPDRCIWRITMSELGGCLIQNTDSSQYLYTNGNSVLASTTLGEVGSAEYEARVWRILSTSYYSNQSTTTYRELTLQTTIANIEGIKDSETTVPIIINSRFENEIWDSPTDFIYEFEDNGTIEYVNGTLKLKEYGGVKVKATHKVTDWVKTFYVLVGFSTTISSTPIADHITAGLAQPYNVWPASEESKFYTDTSAVRHVMLSLIFSEAETVAEGGTWFSLFEAKDMLYHYLANNGIPYEIDFKKTISKWSIARNSRIEDINALMQAVEATATISSQAISTTVAIPHYVDEYTDWGLSIGSYTTSISCTYSKTTNNTYIMQVVYKLHDVYDWDRTKTSMGILPFSQQDMWELHHGGYAKNYAVSGENTFTLTWTEGQTFENGAVMTYET